MRLLQICRRQNIQGPGRMSFRPKQIAVCQYKLHRELLLIFSNRIRPKVPLT